MHILYPIFMLAFVLVAAWIIWKKFLRPLFPQLEIMSKKADIEIMSAAAEEAKGVDLTQAKEDEQAVETFKKETN